MDEASKSFQKLNATGRSLLNTFRPPSEMHEHTACLKKCITALSNYLVDVCDGDLVGLKIRNTENVQGRAAGLSF